MIVITVLLTLVSIIFLLLLLILICPLALQLRAEFKPDYNQVEAQVSLIYSLVKGIVHTDLKRIRITLKLLGLPLPLYRGRLKRKEPKATPPKTGEVKTKGTKPVRQRSVGEWLQFGEGVVTRLKPVVHFERMQADLTVGLATPDQTGLLLGAFYFMRGALNWGSDCRLTPDFLQQRWEGWVQFALSLRLVRLIPVGLFIFKEMRKPISTGG